MNYELLTYIESSHDKEIMACVDTKQNIYTRWISETFSYLSDFIHIIKSQNMILVPDNMSGDSREILSKMFPSYTVICSNSIHELENKKENSKQIWSSVIYKCIDDKSIPDDVMNIIINNCLPNWHNITPQIFNLIKCKPTEQETLINNKSILSLCTIRTENISLNDIVCSDSKLFFQQL
jgi:hypothetical protein